MIATTAPASHMPIALLMSTGGSWQTPLISPGAAHLNFDSASKSPLAASPSMTFWGTLAFW